VRDDDVLDAGADGLLDHQLDLPGSPLAAKFD
jgi:hypothetical protein